MKQRFVLDCSMTTAWLLPHQSTPESKRLLTEMEHLQPVVPVIWEAEIVNVLLVQMHRQRLNIAEVMEFVGYLRKLSMEVHAFGQDLMFTGVFSLAQKFDLSSYDTMYLNLALSESLPLATLDQKLQSAALSCGLRLLP